MIYNGIYPDYVGPTIQHRYASLYPDWVNIGDDFVVVPEGGGGKGKSKNSRETDPLLIQARREDDELLAIIMCAVRVMQ